MIKWDKIEEVLLFKFTEGTTKVKNLVATSVSIIKY